MSRDDAVFVPSGMRVWIVEVNPPPVGICPQNYFDDESLAMFMPSNIRDQESFGACDQKSLADGVVVSVPRLRGMRISFIDKDPDMGRRIWPVDEDSERERRSYLASKCMGDKSHGRGKGDEKSDSGKGDEKSDACGSRSSTNGVDHNQADRISLVGQDSDLVSGFVFVDKTTDLGKSICLTNLCFREKRRKKMAGAYDSKSSAEGDAECDYDNYDFYVDDDDSEDDDDEWYGNEDGDDDDDDEDTRTYLKWRMHTCSLLIQILTYYRSKILRDGVFEPSERRITFVGEGTNVGMKICFTGEFLGDKSPGTSKVT